MPQEQLARRHRVDAAEVHRAVGHQRHAEERDALLGQHGLPLRGPVRFGVVVLRERPGELLGPLGLDLGDGPREQSRGLHELPGHDEPRRLLGECGAGEDQELRVPRAQELPTVRFAEPDLGQQSGEHRLVDQVGRGCRLTAQRVQLPPQVPADLSQLALQVLPLADPHVVQELPLALAAEGAGGQLRAPVAQVSPEVQVREEVRGGVREAGVLRVRGLTVIGGPLADVLDRQAGDDDEYLREHPELPGRDQHARHARIDGQIRELTADCGQPLVSLVRVLERPQLLQQRRAVADGPLVGRLHEREGGDLAQLQRGHREDDRGQVGPQDLGVGVHGPRVEVVLRIQPDRDAVGRAAAAPGALLRRGLRDRFDGEALHLGPHRVPGDARGTGVHHVLDAGHGQRGLGDVGGQDDPPARVRGEDAVLLGGGEPRVEGEDLRAGPHVRLQCLGGVADLALAGEEDEHVAGRLAGELVDGVHDPGDLVERLRVVGHLVERAVPDLHRVRATADLDDGGRGTVGPREVGREPLRLDGRGGDDHLQVGPAGQELPQVPEEEVDVEAAFMGLVDDDRVVVAQQPVAGELAQQDAVGHQLDRGLRRDPVGEPDRVADGVAQLRLRLLRDALGDAAGGEAAGLGVADHAAHAAAELEADLRQLRRLPGAGLARQDDDLVLGDGPRDLFAPGADGQVLGVDDGRHRPLPLGVASPRRLDLAGQLRQIGGLGALEPSAQAGLVPQGERGIRVGAQRRVQIALRRSAVAVFSCGARLLLRHLRLVYPP